MKLKSILLLLCCLLGLVVNAQETDIASKLQQVYRMLSYDSDANVINAAETLLSDISEANVATQPDLVKYLFYYCNAGIMDLKGISSTTKIDFLRKAIALREQSLGVHHAEYTGLLYGLAIELEETDEESAIQLYERALVVGMYPFYAKIDDKSAKHYFGLVMSGLASIYEKKGYEKQLISLYDGAFDLLSSNYIEGSLRPDVPLYLLASYYEKKKDFVNAIRTTNRTLTYIKNSAGCNSTYIDHLHLQASLYEQSGDLKHAIIAYKEVIQLGRKNWGQYDIKFDAAYRDLYLTLIKAGLIKESNDLTYDVADYYKKTNNNLGYANLLYSGIEAMVELNKIEEADALCNRILSNMSGLSTQEQAVIYAKKAMLCLTLTNIPEAIKWQTLAISTTDMLNNRDAYLIRLSDLAYLYMLYGDLKQSLDLYSYLKELIEEADLEMNNIYGQTISAMVEINDNNQTEVGKIWRECLTHIETKYNRTNTQCAAIMNGLGAHLLKTGQQDEAISYFRESAKIYSDLNMLESMEYATTLHNLGRAYMLRRNYKRAKSYLEQAKALQIKLTGTPVERTEQYLTELSSLMVKSR